MVYFNCKNICYRKGKLREIGGRKAVRPGVWDWQVSEKQCYLNPKQKFAWDFFYFFPKVPGIIRLVPGIMPKAGVKNGTACGKSGVRYAEGTENIFRGNLILCH